MRFLTRNPRRRAGESEHKLPTSKWRVSVRGVAHACAGTESRAPDPWYLGWASRRHLRSPR
eukprot:1058161-Prymnesium_polylepis.3